MRFVQEAGFGRHEVALELDRETSLLECLPPDACLEVLAGLDASAGRSPDTGLEVRLADQRQALTVEDEQRHVVHALRVVGREGVLALADVAFPLQ
jgi:hypothetical protein